MELMLQLSEGGSNSELLWLLWLVLGLFLFFVVVGWLVSGRKKPEAEPVHATHHHEEHKQEDNLEIIEGIGPKVAKLLNAAGIHTFSDLANTPASKVEETLKAAGLNMINAAGWIEQAKLAAKGDLEGLKKMQAELKGGRLK